MNEDHRFSGNATGWYVAYRVIAPFLLVAEGGMRLRLWWARRRS